MMAHVVYEPTESMREARARYFEANRFGTDGGYGASFVTVELGPVPLHLPNTRERVRAVRYHDLHHVLTGYDTDLAGEFEISAFEIGAGCRDFWAAWMLNLAGTAGGALAFPRRTFRAFRRGTRSQSLYGLPLEGLLDDSVARVRARMHCPTEAPEVRPRDVLAFGGSVLAGLVVGSTMLVLLVPLTPVLLVVDRLTRLRATRPA